MTRAQPAAFAYGCQLPLIQKLSFPARIRNVTEPPWRPVGIETVATPKAEFCPNEVPVDGSINFAYHSSELTQLVTDTVPFVLGISFLTVEIVFQDVGSVIPGIAYDAQATLEKAKSRSRVKQVMTITFLFRIP